MASKIEWTDETWNPVVGCQVVSPGCTNCYAMKMAGRLEAMSVPHYEGTTQKTKAGFVWTGKIGIAPPSIRVQPLRWRKPRKIFVDSMGDLFHPDVPEDIIRMVFAVAFLTPQHTYQILTKRPDRMREFITSPDAAMSVAIELMGLLLTEEEEGQDHEFEAQLWDLQERLFDQRNQIVHDAWPLSNVLLGASAEDQVRADDRREPMRAIAEAGWSTFVSYEPALGPVDWTGWEFLKWLIAGGESGRGARPPHPIWFEAARDWAAASDVAFLFKQWGHFKPSPLAAGWPVALDGTISKPAAGQGHPPDVVWMMDIGKANAGRLLDGVEHNAMPEVSSEITNLEKTS